MAKTQFSERYLAFYQKKLNMLHTGLIISSFLQFIFMFAIIFKNHLAADLSIAQYLLFSFNLIWAGFLIYPAYMYKNKTFIADLIFISFQLLFLCFIIPVTIFYWHDISITRINDTSAQVIIYLTHAQYVYTACSLWFSLIFIGGSIVASFVAIYFASQTKDKQWKLRTESQRVISKPKN